MENLDTSIFFGGLDLTYEELKHNFIINFYF